MTKRLSSVQSGESTRSPWPFNAFASCLVAVASAGEAWAVELPGVPLVAPSTGKTSVSIDISELPSKPFGFRVSRYNGIALCGGAPNRDEIARSSVEPTRSRVSSIAARGRAGELDQVNSSRNRNSSSQLPHQVEQAGRAAICGVDDDVCEMEARRDAIELSHEIVGVPRRARIATTANERGCANVRIRSNTTLR